MFLYIGYTFYKKENIANAIMNTLLFVGALAVIVPVLWGTFYIITNKGF